MSQARREEQRCKVAALSDPLALNNSCRRWETRCIPTPTVASATQSVVSRCNNLTLSPGAHMADPSAIPQRLFFLAPPALSQPPSLCHCCSQPVAQPRRAEVKSPQIMDDKSPRTHLSDYMMLRDDLCGTLPLWAQQVPMAVTAAHSPPRLPSFWDLGYSSASPPCHDRKTSTTPTLSEMASARLQDRQHQLRSSEASEARAPRFISRWRASMRRRLGAHPSPGVGRAPGLNQATELALKHWFGLL
ncbi:hypothetical protein MUK42_35658 [Musa troglodytarum]|uniref:Uncharacterized protein n=1 Tax=Musa troglodytarum TaxID=320322 RepID=A0A9E7EN94_9LILI|nr:hypothetical protein MUK42_35658 [Musa troglodytarum]